MKKVQIIIDSVLAVAIVALFVLYFVAPRGAKSVEVAEQSASLSERLPIAYVNLDSLLTEYEFAVEANDALMTKQENAQVKLVDKQRSLQKDYEDYQHKVENRAFFSPERQQQAEQKLYKKQEELRSLEEKLTQEIMQETQQLNLQLRDSLNNFLAEYNADKKFEIIFANAQSDNVLIAQQGYDITREVIDALNARYHKK